MEVCNEKRLKPSSAVTVTHAHSRTLREFSDSMRSDITSQAQLAELRVQRSPQLLRDARLAPHNKKGVTHSGCVPCASSYVTLVWDGP